MSINYKSPIRPDIPEGYEFFFPEAKRESIYYKYFSHLSYDVVMDKCDKSPSFWRNCLILFMVSSGVPRKKISELMCISLSRINEITLNTKKQLLSKEKLSPITEVKETVWYVREKYLKSPKFKYSAMELCRDASEHTLSHILIQSNFIVTIADGYKLANEYWEKLQEKLNNGHYLIHTINQII